MVLPIDTVRGVSPQAHLESYLQERDETDRTDADRELKQNEPILCPHCQRTASNGIKCKGLCVADSDY